MIPAPRKTLRAVTSRPAPDGTAQTWSPDCPIPVTFAATSFSLSAVQRVPVGAFRPAVPVWTEIDRDFLPGLPTQAEAEDWILGQPVSYPIGWFDTARFQELLAAAEEKEESGDSGGSGSSPLSPENDFLRRLAAVLQPPLAALVAPNGVLDWPAPLLPYQREGIAALLSHRELLLADDMGLGKTVQAVAALRLLAFQQQIASALVVCPASLLSQWRRELARWAAELRVVTIAGSPAERGSLWRVPAHVKLISYETLRADVMDLADSPALRETWGVVVLDEASRIKNRESGISLACMRLPRERRWALTGTPLENQPEDILALLDFLLGEPGRRPRIPPGTPALRTQLQAVQLRRKKEDVLTDLPPRQVNELVIELPPAQRAAYDRAEREGILQLTAAGASITVTHVLELISHLKQLCNVDPVSGESAKLADIRERLGTLVAQGHRALLFSQFTDARFGVRRAAAALQAFAPLLFTGDMTAAQRARTVDVFLADARHKILLLSLRAGGVGLNLQAASYVFHLDRWWNPAIEEQADSRAHRMGQRYPVTIFRYVCLNTLEERIDAKLKEKRKLFQEIVDDVSLDLAATLNEEELFGLFGLPGPHTRRR